MKHGVTRHGALICATLMVLTVLTAAAAHAQPAAIVRGLLDDAAQRFDIPRPVLYGIAWNESRWRHIPHDSLPPSCTGMPPAIGIMGLHDDPYFGKSLHAGEALGISADEARASIEKNITAGALHLSSLFNGNDRSDIAQWTDAIGRYSGIPEKHAALRLLYADGVLELIRRGWHAEDQYVAAAPVPAIDRAMLAAALERMGLRAGTVMQAMPDAVPDYSGAVWQPSPNFSSREGTPITAVAIHDTEGGFAGSISWLTSTQAEASAHYIIRSVDGFIVQMVREEDKAWHVRTENPYSIGIEHEGYVTRPEFFTPEMYQASADLVRYLIAKYNIPLRRDRVKGHLDFPNNTHTDPGGWWDWPAYYRLIANAPAMPVVVDPFEDNVVGWWQPELSGSTFGVDTTRTAFAIANGAGTGGTNAAELTYAFTDASGGVVRYFRSGHGNPRDGLLNVGSDGIVTLAVEGDGSGNDLQLWFYDTTKANVIHDAGTMNWTGRRTVAVPVASPGTAGPYRLHSIVIRQREGAAREGRVIVDDLAHETMLSGVGISHHDEAAQHATKIAVRAGDALPEALGAHGGARIYTALGMLVGRMESAAHDHVSGRLTPGAYLLVFDDRTVVHLLVTP